MGGRQVKGEAEKERSVYGGHANNINGASALPAGAHSAPNTHCHSD